jgi:hypothetical protein
MQQSAYRELSMTIYGEKNGSGSSLLFSSDVSLGVVPNSLKIITK